MRGLIMKMASQQYLSMVVLSFCVVLHLRVALVVSQQQNRPAPALYVFGDSLVDGGNNNLLQTKAKANYKPYGIDFTAGSTGRFSNGNTIVDYIAKWLGLPLVPAYLSLSDGERSKITTGLNYASASAGIFPETGTALGDNLSMDEQLKYFQRTVQNDLPKLFNNKRDLSHYLSKSIFMVSIGSSDYINNFLQPANYNSSTTYTEEQYGELLLNGLEDRLTKLYNLGARKFVVFEIGPLGCVPAIINRVDPKLESTCFENVNNLVNIFNAGLPRKISGLNTYLKGSTFVRAEIFLQIYKMSQYPPKHGFSVGRTPCCAVGGNGTTLCLPNRTPCQDRNKRLWWDSFHPTEAVQRRVARSCFKGSKVCVPINIQQLVQKQ